MKRLFRIALLALAFAGCFTLFALAESAGAVLTVFIGIQAALVVLATLILLGFVLADKI